MGLSLHVNPDTGDPWVGRGGRIIGLLYYLGILPDDKNDFVKALWEAEIIAANQISDRYVPPLHLYAIKRARLFLEWDPKTKSFAEAMRFDRSQIYRERGMAA